MDFNECKQIWDFSKEAYFGNGGFLDGSYIDKYVREDDTKYENRQEIAYYTNVFASKVNRFVGYIYKKLPVRNTCLCKTSLHLQK